MAYLTGEVVPNTSGGAPFNAVFRHGDDGKAFPKWPRSAVAEVEEQII